VGQFRGYCEVVPDARGEEHPLAVKVTAATIGAAAGLAGREAAMLGAGLTPMIEEVIGRVFAGMTERRVKCVNETLVDAAEVLGGDATEHLRRIADTAATDETFQEMLVPWVPQLM
jgi:demethoxyubiquinone hydroxylase (CLK1/Coq7/Cat5 family)